MGNKQRDADRNGSTDRPYPTRREASVSQLAPGTVLGGHYQILEAVGSGGMGRVYKALDQSLNRFVAIKVMRSGFTGTDPNSHEEFKKRFEGEAMLPASINHPNVITIFGRGQHGRLSYFVMEYVDHARSLQELVDESYYEGVFINLSTVRELFIQATRGLQAIHQSRPGVLHRDIKLGNLLIFRDNTGRWQLKIIDFGLVKLPRADGDLTQSGLLIGTPSYIPPEYFESVGGEPITLDERADLYALGIALYQTLTFRKPYPNIRDPRDAMAIYQSDRTPTAPSSLRSGLPPGWDTVVMKLLEKNRSSRYQTALNLYAALNELDVIETGEAVHPEEEITIPGTANPAVSSSSNAILQALEKELEDSEPGDTSTNPFSAVEAPVNEEIPARSFGSALGLAQTPVIVLENPRSSPQDAAHAQTTARSKPAMLQILTGLLVGIIIIGTLLYMLS